MSMEMPRVYETETGGYTRRLHPISCSVYQSLAPLSTANMELPTTDEIKPFDWVQIFTPDGKSEYYRVASVTTNAVTGDQSVYLEHGACTLGDVLIPDTAVDAQTTPTSSHGANLKEYPENKTDTIRNILTYILGKQPSPARWSVGTVDATDTIYIELGGFSLLSSISSMMQYIPDYQLEFVQTDSTWTVNIKHRPTTVLCEGRLSRNLASCDISYNTANIITRVYSDGVSGGHIDSSNVNVYGLHEETMTMSESLSEAQKVAIIQSYLRNHDHPTVSVTISGVELSQITGLEIDAFKVGAVCRIAIPWLSINEEQVIIDKNYSDCYNFPEEVTITLANATPDLVIAMAAITSTVSGGGGGIGGGLKAEQEQKEKEKKRYETRMEKTDEYFRFLATDTQWDEMGQGTLTAYAQLVVTSNSIQSVVNDIAGSGYSSITQLANSVTSVVSKTGVNKLGEDETLYSQIQQEADKISTIVQNVGSDGTVTAASIVTAINGDTGTVVISADKIDLNGLVSATEFQTALASIDNLVGDLNVVGAVTVGGNLSAGSLSAESYSDYKVDGESIGLGNAIKQISLSGPTNDVYTLTATKLDGDTVQIGTFSRATTLSGAWSSGTFTVTATPQGDTLTTSLTNTGHWGNPSLTAGEDENTYYYATKATIGNSATIYDTGNTTTISGLGRYNAGVTYGQGSVRITSVDGADQGDPYYNVNPASITATASNGATYTRSLYLTQGSWNSSNQKAVNIRVGTTSGDLIGRIWINAPSVNVGTPYMNQPAQGKIRAVCVVNGQTYYGATHSLSEYS